NSDLYPRWLGSREALLHHRDPYGADVTREIQTGFLFKIHGDPIFNPYGWQGFLIEVIKDGFKTNFEI
ncbi:MAG: hypothetical protein ABR980_02565, partial [Ignavibacteriaceae bacterium]